MAYYDKDEITFKSLVMKQVQKIQEITSKELRDGEKTVKNLIGEQVVDAEDTRYSYLQSIEMFGSLLYPYLITINETDYKKEFDEFCNLYDIELAEAIKDKDFKKELKNYFVIEEVTQKEINSKGLLQQVNIYLLNYKIKEARKMFRLLFTLVKHYDFFGATSYTDGDLGGGETDSNLDAVVEDNE